MRPFRREPPPSYYLAARRALQPIQGEGRAALRENCVFPEKTKSETVFSFDLDLSNDRGRYEYQVDLLDVPGERFYDIAMFGCDYAQWCDQMEKSWHDEPHPAMNAYRTLFDGPAANLDAPAVIAAYRNLLAELIAAYRIGAFNA